MVAAIEKFCGAPFKVNPIALFGRVGERGRSSDQNGLLSGLLVESNLKRLNEN
ncbi:MAG: hypothetical protein ACJASX_003610 [Limisphaerales bacterium]|jgi:hypothetical protein